MEVAAELHEALKDAYDGLDEKSLSDSTVVRYLPVPSVEANPRNFPEEGFSYIGRSWFPKMADFVGGHFDGKKVARGKQLGLSQDEQKRAKRWKDHIKGRPQKGAEGYIIGPPGEGKSVGFAVVAGYLHAKGEFRVVYLSALRLMTDFDQVLRAALYLAVGGDQEATTSLTVAENIGVWLRNQPKTLFLVDDFNELDENRKQGLVGTADERTFAKSTLATLSHRHVVIYCCSAGSEVRAMLTRPTRPPYLVISSGFNKVELKTFLTNYGLTEDEDMIKKTGNNPRLLQFYVDQTLDKELPGMEDTLNAFILNLDDTEYEEFVFQLAGDVAPPLPRAMDSRCFFVQEGKTELEAISHHFHSLALRTCIDRDRSLLSQAQEEHIACFVNAVRWDGGMNMTRNGWNSEEATLLVLASCDVAVPLQNGKFWVFKAQAVKAFKGGIDSASLEQGARSVLHLPTLFDCKAVDCLIEGKLNGKTVAAGIQVSVNIDPQGSHEGAIKEFLRMMKGKKYDMLLFIWIGHFPGNFEPQESTEVVEITMSFNAVHSLLADLDVVCANVRVAQVLKQERLPCKAITVQSSPCSLTVESSNAVQLCHIHAGMQPRIKEDIDGINHILDKSKQEINSGISKEKHAELRKRRKRLNADLKAHQTKLQKMFP